MGLAEKTENEQQEIGIQPREQDVAAEVAIQ
jgi:hypothetical protein